MPKLTELTILISLEKVTSQSQNLYLLFGVIPSIFDSVLPNTSLVIESNERKVSYVLVKFVGGREGPSMTQQFGDIHFNGELFHYIPPSIEHLSKSEDKFA